jgi:hypothetical protein
MQKLVKLSSLRHEVLRTDADAPKAEQHIRPHFATLRQLSFQFAVQVRCHYPAHAITVKREL